MFAIRRKDAYPSYTAHRQWDIYNRWFVLVIDHYDARVLQKNPFQYLNIVNAIFETFSKLNGASIIRILVDVTARKIIMFTIL